MFHKLYARRKTFYFVFMTSVFLSFHVQPPPQALRFSHGKGERALHLCPPLQFGPLTYQPIEWGFISSNQSAL